MPIPVTCPECQYHFLVGDEFAGRPGRCPECAGLIQVPDPSADAVRIDPPPYHTPRAVEAFEDLPEVSARRRPDDRGRLDAGRSGLPLAPPRERSFDAQARAARWHSVSRGFGNLTVAVVLLAIDEMVACAFTLVDGVRPGQQDNLGPREKALLIGNVLFSAIALVLWAAGRIGCGKVPYLPARKIAGPAGVIAGMTAFGGVIALGGILGGLLLAQQNQAAGAGLILLGGCAILPTMAGLVVAEVMGLISQLRIAHGLRDEAFARSSRVLLTVAILLTFVTMFGVCGLTMFMFAEMGKKAQAQQQQQQQQQPPPANPADENVKDAPPPAVEPAPAPKGKGRGKRNANAPAAQQQPQQPPPEIDWGEYPMVVYGITFGRMFIALAYAITAVMCFQFGRSAVRREIARLTGDPNDTERMYDRYS